MKVRKYYLHPLSKEDLLVLAVSKVLKSQKGSICYVTARKIALTSIGKFMGWDESYAGKLLKVYVPRTINLDHVLWVLTKKTKRGKHNCYIYRKV